jgi:antitoxin (DNA-binding transcriptional repressor) of toxin-antitoxin stability system
MNVSVHGAKTQLSRLLDLVEGGEQVVIERLVTNDEPIRSYPVRTTW